jgi:hypothetical protein
MQYRKLFLLFALSLTRIAAAQDLEIATRPDAIYIERMEGNITPMERVFFHIVLRNASKSPLSVDWVRFDLSNSQGVIFSGQYSGAALTDLFDSAIDRRRIEPTPKKNQRSLPGTAKGDIRHFLRLSGGNVWRVRCC